MTENSTGKDPIMPAIRSAAGVRGRTFVFYDATPEDVGSVFDLRRLPKKSHHVSPVSGWLEDQRRWLESYARSEGQAYFVIRNEGRRIGVVRLYYARCDCFCWGSWILTDYQPRHAAMESALMIYAYTVDHLDFDHAHFDERFGNKRVLRFHARMGARKRRRGSQDAFSEMTSEAIRAVRESRSRYLPGGGWRSSSRADRRRRRGM